MLCLEGALIKSVFSAGHTKLGSQTEMQRMERVIKDELEEKVTKVTDY